MADQLKQDEAIQLIAMEKICLNNNKFTYPAMGGKLIIPLYSRDQREQFFLDINKSSYKLTKAFYNNRAKGCIVLVRLCLDSPHRNPDGERIEGSHLHIYREGYADQWAKPIPPEIFKNPSDLWVSLYDFFQYCNITEPPNIERGLFI